MLEKIIKRKYYLEHHHLNAPLLAEREAYLTAMYNRGLSRGMLLSTADYLLRIIELLNLKDDIPFRKVSIGEVESAGVRWARTIKNHPMRSYFASESPLWNNYKFKTEHKRDLDFLLKTIIFPKIFIKETITVSMNYSVLIFR